MQRDDVIRVLGPIDLLGSSGAVPVGGRGCRAVLAALVVAAGHAVSTHQLKAVLWGDHQPASADESLQTNVSRLRHLLGHETIVHSDHTYRLAVCRDQIDALHFEDLLSRAIELRDDPGGCRAVCRQALGLWRGEPFGDLADDEPFRLEAMRLDELRVATMELALECELALQRYDTVVAELESAVEEHPYRERLWYLLIEALYCDERRVEALRACQRLRAVLAEAGLEAGDELRALEDHVVRDAHPPAGRAAAPRVTAPSAADPRSVPCSAGFTASSGGERRTRWWQYPRRG